MPRLKISEFSAVDLVDLVSTDVIPIVSNDDNKKVSLATLTDYVSEDLALGGAALLNVGQTTGTVAAGNDARIPQPGTPASASATGVEGTVVWDGSYVYICVATDTWKRAALSTW